MYHPPAVRRHTLSIGRTPTNPVIPFHGTRGFTSVKESKTTNFIYSIPQVLHFQIFPSFPECVQFKRYTHYCSIRIQYYWCLVKIYFSCMLIHFSSYCGSVLRKKNWVMHFHALFVQKEDDINISTSYFIGLIVCRKHVPQPIIMKSKRKKIGPYQASAGISSRFSLDPV
jgi:hypothetical protein